VLAAPVLPGVTSLKATAEALLVLMTTTLMTTTLMTTTLETHTPTPAAADVQITQDGFEKVGLRRMSCQLCRRLSCHESRY